MDVSVIVPALNSERFLAEALASVRNQGGTKIELLVIDGGSTDGIGAIAQEFGATMLTQSGRGLSDAWNTGVRAAGSANIAFLDSDDVWELDTLAPRLDLLSKNASSGICVGKVLHVLAEGTQKPAGFRPELFELSLVAPIPGTMIVKKRVFDEIGLFDTNLKTAGDSDWVARAVNHAVKFESFDRLVLRKRIHGSNLTLNAATVNAELLTVLRRNILQKRALSGEPHA
jgi:glycosyltransferase involved in cell wall biosynthesis